MLNCVRWVTLGSLFYLLVDVFGLWYYLFDVDYGLEVILGWIHSAVSAVLLIAAHIIALVKRKKYEMQPGEDIQRWPLLYLLVAVCFFSCFALEYEVLQDANIIIPHSPSSWAGDEYGLVVTDVTALPIQVGERYYKDRSGVERRIPHNAFVAFVRLRTGARIGVVTITDDGKFELNLRDEYQFAWEDDSIDFYYTDANGDVYNFNYTENGVAKAVDLNLLYTLIVERNEPIVLSME
jgi:hypothetical protein